MSIAKALFSERQLRLFTWLFGQPGRQFHLSELRRLTGLGSASLQSEMTRLTEAGLINSWRVGNQRRFQANPNSPIYQELTALTHKLLGIPGLLAEALAPLRPRLAGAWLYGSVAKASDVSDSDIDVMLVGDGLPLADVLALTVPLETKLGRKINPVCYTEAEFERRRVEPDSFVNRVLAQATLRLVEGRL